MLRVQSACRLQRLFAYNRVHLSTRTSLIHGYSTFIASAAKAVPANATFDSYKPSKSCMYWMNASKAFSTNTPIDETSATKVSSIPLSASTVLQDVAKIQAKLGESHSQWIQRVAAGSTLHEEPFRLTVIGDAGSGQNAVMAALLSQPTLDLFDKSKILKASYGVSTETPSISLPTTVNIRSQSSWLNETGVEVSLISGLEVTRLQSDAVQDTLLKSDAILLVTHSSRELTGVIDEMVVKNFLAKGKSNVFVVAITETDSSHLKSAAANLEAKLAADMLQSDLKSLPIHNLTMSDGKLVDFSDSTIKSTIFKLVKSIDKAKNNTSLFLAWSALQHLSNHHTVSMLHLQDAHEEIAAAAKHIVKHEQRLVREFRQSDLGVVQSSIISLTDAFKLYFSKMPFWKLFWRSDFISEDLFSRMREHSFIRAEFQMTYATGKANEALYQLNHNLVDRLQPMTLSTHVLAKHPITAALQENILQLLSIVKRYIPLSNDVAGIDSSSVEIDKFLLRNEVAAFDESSHCDLVQKQAQKIVQRQFSVQFLVAVSALLATHLGVPLAVCIPSWVLVSGLGFGWMNLKWLATQRRFLRDISESQKTLKSRLSTVYDNEFTRVIAAPLAVSVKMIEEAIHQRTLEATAARKYLDELLLQCKDSNNVQK
ncbi:hypothetical protein MT418_000955 [Batrachochytrium dendrobatidis]